MMKKRAEFSEVARLLLVIFFAILVIAAVTVFVIYLKNEADRSACTQSIIQSGLEGVPNFDCKAERITITLNDLEDAAGGELDEEGLDDATKMWIANEMYACWKKTAKGMVDPYRKTAEDRFVSLFQDSQIMLICDIIEFKRVPSINGLLFWMATNKPKGADEPYYDLFYGKPTEEELEIMEQQYDTYDLSREYTITWMHSWYEPSNSIIFVPYEDLAKPPKLTSLPLKILDVLIIKFDTVVMN